MLKALIHCIQNENVEQLQALLEENRALAVGRKHGNTMLHLAVQRRNTAIIQLLLDYEAEQKPNRHGQTPLHLAAIYGHIEIMEMLLEYGAPIDAVDERGDSPLYIAVSHAGQMMAYHGADISTCDKFIKAVFLLVINGANPNLANKDGGTPLLAAAWYGNASLVDFLLQYSAEINQRNKKGESPLFAAAARGHVEVVKTLLKHGAKVDQPNEDGKTPLDIARIYGHIAVVELLEEARSLQKNSHSVGLRTHFFKIENSPADSLCAKDSEDESDCEDESDSEDEDFNPVLRYQRRNSL